MPRVAGSGGVVVEIAGHPRGYGAAGGTDMRFGTRSSLEGGR